MKKIFLICYCALGLFSCASYDSYYKLDENYLARRQIETAHFDTNDEELILSASTGVLQDLGFTIEESETKLGLITASKKREAGNTGAKIALVMLSALSKSNNPPVYDTEQKIYTTLVSTKSRNSAGYNVRIEFARIIWNNKNESRIEKITDPQIYQDFFDKLGQSLFLTANSI